MISAENKWPTYFVLNHKWLPTVQQWSPCSGASFMQLGAPSSLGRERGHCFLLEPSYGKVMNQKLVSSIANNLGWMSFMPLLPGGKLSQCSINLWLQNFQPRLFSKSPQFVHYHSIALLLTISIHFRLQRSSNLCPKLQFPPVWTQAPVRTVIRFVQEASSTIWPTLPPVHTAPKHVMETCQFWKFFVPVCLVNNAIVPPRMTSLHHVSGSSANLFLAPWSHRQLGANKLRDGEPSGLRATQTFILKLPIRMLGHKTLGYFFTKCRLFCPCLCLYSNN